MSDNPLTREHLTAFGAIIAAWARLECQLEVCVSVAFELPAWKSMLATSQMGYRAKAGLMRVLAAESAWPEEHRKLIESLIDRMDTISKTRDLVAHSSWTAGRASSSIKPIRMTARGKLKLYGLDHNEPEFTIGSLWDTVHEIDSVSVALSRFLYEHAPEEVKAEYSQAISSSASLSDASEPPR